MSAKDGCSGSEGKKGPPPVQRMAQREPCCRFPDRAALRAHFWPLMLAIAVSDSPPLCDFQRTDAAAAALALLRAGPGWVGGGLRGGVMGHRKSPLAVHPTPLLGGGRGWRLSPAPGSARHRVDWRP